MITGTIRCPAISIRPAPQTTWTSPAATVWPVRKHRSCWPRCASAFPFWTITYAEQMRAWIARTGARTICQNSAVMLCAALTVIEGKELINIQKESGLSRARTTQTRRKPSMTTSPRSA